MDSTRKTAVVAGVVFIVATVASILGSSFVPALTGTDYLARVSENADQVAVGAFLISDRGISRVPASPSRCIRS